MLTPQEILLRIQSLSDYDMFAVMEGAELIGVIRCLPNDTEKRVFLFRIISKRVCGGKDTQRRV